MAAMSKGTYILVRNNLDILDMAGGLEDLAQNILRHPRVKSTDVKRPLVRLRRRSTREGTAASGRHDTLVRGCNGSRNGVRVRRDMKRRRRHVGRISLAVLARIKAGGADIWLRGRQLVA